MGADGRPARPGLIPTLEESVENRTWVIGTAEEVAAGIAAYRDRLGLTELCIFPNFNGDSYAKTAEQLSRYAEEVRPLLG